MVRILQDKNLLIVYAKQFLFFEWKLRESDLTVRNIKVPDLRSPRFNLGGEEDSFLEFQVHVGFIKLFLHNFKPVENGSYVLTIFDSNNSCIASKSKSLIDTNSKFFNLFPDIDLIRKISRMSSGAEYPIVISCTAKSPMSTLSMELNVAQDYESSMRVLSLDLRKILEQALNTDIVLSTDGENLKAHRIVLQARSPVFRKMFDYDSSEAVENTVAISDIGSATVKRLVSFLYTATLEKCDFDETLELYYAADKYEVLSLRDECKTELLKNIDVNNACSLFTLASRHNDENLKKGVVQFVSANFISVVNMESFMEMSKEDMALLTRLCACAVKK